MHTRQPCRKKQRNTRVLKTLVVLMLSQRKKRLTLSNTSVRTLQSLGPSTGTLTDSCFCVPTATPTVPHQTRGSLPSCLRRYLPLLRVFTDSITHQSARSSCTLAMASQLTGTCVVSRTHTHHPSSHTHTITAHTHTHTPSQLALILL